MAYRVPITVRLESFEGPLDLLLYLIQSHEMDISKVSISRITDQYLAYVRLMQELNFDIASEFLVMAATLLHWKSKALLPREKDDQAQNAEEEAGLTQEELIRQLLEHQRFLAAGQDLAQLPYLGEDVFKRPVKRAPVEKIWGEMDITSLTKTYLDLVTKARKRTTVLKKETVSIASRILEMKDRLKVGKLTALQELLSVAPTRPEIVATFLASLELGRMKKLKLFQDGVYQPIYLELLTIIRASDTELATGFEADVAAAAKAEDKVRDDARAASVAQASGIDLTTAFEDQEPSSQTPAPSQDEMALPVPPGAADVPELRVP